MRAFLTSCRQRAARALASTTGYLSAKARYVLKTYNELHLAVVLVLLWLPVQYGFWWFFPDAAPMSGGHLQKLYMAALVFAFGHGFLWVGLQLNLPPVFHWVENHFKDAFNSLTPWQKCLFFLGFFATYLHSFALIWHGCSQMF